MNSTAWITPESQPWDEITVCEECGVVDGEHDAGCSLEEDPFFAPEGLASCPDCGERYVEGSGAGCNCDVSYAMEEEADFDPFTRPEGGASPALPPVKGEEE